MLSRANIVDGIFLFQVGLHVNVTELAVLSQEPDPFSALEPSALLDELEEYRATTPAQSSQDLTHLLTGRDLAERVSQTWQTVGIANFATVCDARLGTSVTQATFGITTDALIMAHELGHNFGAPHDGEPGSPCANESTSYLMAEVVNRSREFSACSIQQMQPTLHSACLDVLTDGDTELRTVSAPADAIFGENFEVHIAVDNPSASDAHGIELTAGGTNLTIVALLGSAFDCTLAPPRCRKNVLTSGQSAGLRIVGTANAAEPATLNVAVDTLNDPNAANNAASYVIGVRPTVDLVVDLGSAPSLVRLGEPIDLSATLRNAGANTATNAAAMVNITQMLTDVELASDVGSCTRDSSVLHRCPLGDLAPGAVRVLSLRARAIDAGSVSAGFTSASVRVEASADQRALDFARSVKSKDFILAKAIADLRTTVAPAFQFQLDGPAEVVVTIDNLGPDPAADVVLEQRGGQFTYEGLKDVVATSNVGECSTPMDGTPHFSCHVFTLPVGERLVVTMRGKASRLGQWGLTSTAVQETWDPMRDNNVVSAHYNVTEVGAQPPPTAGTGGTGSADGAGSTVQSGGGGGGAVDAGYLTLLMLALAARLVRCLGTRNAKLTPSLHVSACRTKIANAICPVQRHVLRRRPFFEPHPAGSSPPAAPHWQRRRCETRQVHPRRRHERRQPGHKVQRLQHDVHHPVAIRGLPLVTHGCGGGW